MRVQPRRDAAGEICRFGDHRGLDHAGVHRGHHLLARVTLGQRAHGTPRRGPRSRTSSPPGRDQRVGVGVPLGHPEAVDHLLPAQSVRLAREELAQLRAPARSRSVALADHRPEEPCRLDRPGAGSRRRARSPLPARPVRESRSARAITWRRPNSGQAGAAALPADDAVDVADRFAVADEHDAGAAVRRGRRPGGHRRRAVSAGRRRTVPGGAGPAVGPRSGSLTPGCRRNAPAGAASGTRPPRRSGRRTPPRWNRPIPSSHAVRD